MNIQEWIEAGKPWNVILHGDCMELMEHIEDKSIELACVDPPYGIGMGATGSYYNKKNQLPSNPHIKKNWDSAIPEKKYFDELFRISQNQIIWGGNYFTEYLKPSRCWVFWDKMKYVDNYADGELAWTSFDRNTKKILIQHHGFLNRDGKSIHPMQKPVALYRWILQNYAKPGDKIIDTHSGSGSLACACHLEKFDFLAIEKDVDYYKSSVERLDTLRSQGVLF